MSVSSVSQSAQVYRPNPQQSTSVKIKDPDHDGDNDALSGANESQEAQRGGALNIKV